MHPSARHTIPMMLALTLCGNSSLIEQSHAHPIQKRETMRDAHSFSTPEQVRVQHLSLQLDVNFEARILRGRASLQLDRRDPEAALVLDSRDLTILNVFLDDGQSPAEFELSEPIAHLGSALTIKLPRDVAKVHIEYETSPAAMALQWLEPRQTAGGRHPFLFSQSQAILARTWIPCQDSPGVRITYDAKVTVPPDMMAVMSASNPQARRSDGVYRFEMTQPVPSYLLALAAGDLEFRALGSRSGIYAEPSIVEAAAWEFAQTERMIAAAEELYGPYRWDRYDILVLPPSFPFGGMENPRLTFATPTVLAGDRSLVALIAHELAHSWSGNLVTNATWNDFWLNEGFTVYFEHRIMEAVNGRSYDEMSVELGREALVREMKQLPPRDTWLHLDLAGRDPDEGLTDVAYEKGYLLLRLLEETVGRDKWDPFLQSYFDKFAFQSMTTERFLKYLNDELLDELPTSSVDDLKIDEWVYGPGLPSNAPITDASELRQVKSQAERFLGGEPATELTTANWTTHHWLRFLRSLPRPLSQEQMRQLDTEFQLTDSGNSEVLHDWLLHAISADYQPAMDALADFLTRQGRRKFLTPLYRELILTEPGRVRAESIYRKARPMYHPVSVATIDSVLRWNAENKE